jgi:hypothetical protein
LVIFQSGHSSVDFVTAGIETQRFGEPPPLNAPQLIGTFPKVDDLKELQKLKQLAESII